MHNPEELTIVRYFDVLCAAIRAATAAAAAASQESKQEQSSVSTHAAHSLRHFVIRCKNFSVQWRIRLEYKRLLYDKWKTRCGCGFFHSTMIFAKTNFFNLALSRHRFTHFIQLFRHCPVSDFVTSSQVFISQIVTAQFLSERSSSFKHLNLPITLRGNLNSKLRIPTILKCKRKFSVILCDVCAARLYFSFSLSFCECNSRRRNLRHTSRGNESRFFGGAASSQSCVKVVDDGRQVQRETRPRALPDCNIVRWKDKIQTNTRADRT